MRMYFATNPLTRLEGIIRGRGADQGECLALCGCNDVHTFGIPFALDIAFVDKDGIVLEVARKVPARKRIKCSKACVTIERKYSPEGWFKPGEKLVVEGVEP